MDDEAKQWLNLHEKMSNGSIDKSDYYITDTSQQGSGDITLVTPTQAQVEQAKSQMKRKLSVVKNPPAKRRKQTGGKKKAGSKKKPVKKKGQKGGKRIKKPKRDLLSNQNSKKLEKSINRQYFSYIHQLSVGH